MKRNKKDAGATDKALLIVAIGASSGGLEAGLELFKNLPADTGMAFIFIQHLSPNYKSLLTSLLAKATSMKVQEIEDMEHMEANNVYVIPNDKGIKVTDGHIQLIQRSKSVAAVSIDVLFASLAETHKQDAIGVVLSGNASDGTNGLRAIKQEGGITFAQDNSAKYDSMPQSAINEGVADFVLSPKQIAQELARISKHASKKHVEAKGTITEIDDNDENLKTILQILQKETGIDFTHYKMGTIKRRILRRLFIYRLKTLAQYVQLLKTRSNEATVLYNDMLINVTDFFRDADAFQYLKTTLLPRLIKNKAADQPLRVWVAACSTGQEAYSIAMLLIEILEGLLPAKHIQIFGTDLSAIAIKKARKGQYSRAELKSVSPQRLTRFFTQEEDVYTVTKELRDVCSFSPHNILSDPPFSRIDFISCCNLLIYFDNVMHTKVFKTFRYALNDGGSLMLSRSEAIGASQLFVQTNKKYKIYEPAKGPRTLPDLVYRTPAEVRARAVVKPLRKTAFSNSVIADSVITELLMARYIPTYVIINYARKVLQFKGATSNYLEHATGKATLNILTMARPEMSFELRDAINKAIETQKEISKTGIEIKNGNVLYSVSLDAIPVNTEGMEPLLLIIFTQKELAEKRMLSDINVGEVHGTSKKLKEELAMVRADLISASKENEKANKILMEANEEILSSNEEFQSMNEELETSKEEIESANQELITTNQELQTRNELLAEAGDFSEAILATLHEPILILDRNLHIKSANKAFSKKFELQQADIEGKLLYDLDKKKWDIPQFHELLDNFGEMSTAFYDYEITHEFAGIGKRTMLLNAMHIRQKVQNEQLILLAFTDATVRTRESKAEKKELEDVINARTLELKKSMESLSENNLSLIRINKELETFTFISSHDLQEPLRKIKNFATFLLKEEKENLSATGKNYLQRMQDSVSRMQRLIEDLLLYARVKDNKHKLEKTDINKIIKEVVADFRETVIEKKVKITVTGKSEGNIIPFQFRQLMHNLVSNAIKFAHGKRLCEIDIRCETKLGSKLSDDLDAATSYCHFSIADNGIGFDAKYRDRIFEVFQRLHEYEDYKGTGMGLAICKRIVEQHHGFITATSKLNKGARFDIYIPTL